MCASHYNLSPNLAILQDQAKEDGRSTVLPRSPGKEVHEMAGKILLVDDDDNMRNMLHAFLKADGYSIDAAEGVNAALQ
jgi:PleD family two-component response regulator